MKTHKKLLILEFITHERWVFNSRFLPFIKGYAEELGMETLWLCYGTKIQTEKLSETQITQYMDLTPEELSFLEKYVDQLKPTHIMTTHLVSPKVTQCLTKWKDEVPEFILSSMSQDQIPNESNKDKLKDPSLFGFSLPQFDMAQSRAFWIYQWFGEEEKAQDKDAYIVGTFRPSYDAIMANDDATNFRPHVIIMGGLACDHRKKIHKNPHFNEVSFEGLTHDFGCSYCTWYRGPTSDLKVDAVTCAEEQFRRVIETTGNEGRNCGIFEVYDIRLFSRLERFFEMILDLDLGPSTFCFEPRLDRFLKVSKKLEIILPKLEEAGHVVYLLRMGAESLVEEENVLYNKHITLDQIDRATVKLRELVKKYPKSFDFDPTWGYITCSPWTTIEMFEDGIDKAIERKFEPLGVWLYTPLLLYNGSPITQLAYNQKDIIVDEFEDLSLLYEPAVNQVPFETLTPWRFKDQRMSAAFALLVRVCAAGLRHKNPDTIFKGDELYSLVLELEQDKGPYTRPDIYALKAISAVKKAAPPYDLRALLLETLDSYSETLRADPVLASVGGTGPAEADSLLSRQEKERLSKYLSIMKVITKKMSRAIGDIVVENLWEDRDNPELSFEILLEDKPYHLSIKPRNPDEPHMFSTDNFNLSYSQKTPLNTKDHIKKVTLFVTAFDKALSRYEPELILR